MQVYFALVEAGSGRIMQAGEAPDYAIEHVETEHQLVEIWADGGGGINDVDHYFDGAAFVERPMLTVPATAEIVADGEDALTVTDLPAGTIVIIGGEEAVVDDGALEFATEQRGTVRLIIRPPFPHREYRTMVTAT